MRHHALPHRTSTASVRAARIHPPRDFGRVSADVKGSNECPSTRLPIGAISAEGVAQTVPNDAFVIALSRG